jgi:hypothetical protein
MYANPASVFEALRNYYVVENHLFPVTMLPKPIELKRINDFKAVQ